MERANALSFVKMILKEDIEKIANIKATELNGYIVDVTVNAKNDIFVYFDKCGGVNIDECVNINRYINEKFDREIEDYSLTVCSPGIDRPFKKRVQYKINEGKEVIVKKNDGKKISGFLKSYENKLVLATKDKSKVKQTNSNRNNIVIPFEEIKETRLKIKFK
tara:strand:- start:1538 stop:2026 length:489 start_codon:yes stop_codon:yes gene_type:complete